MKNAQRVVVAKTTLRSSGADVSSKLHVVINVCTYKEDGRIERRLEICGNDGSTIAVIDVCPAGEILIDVAKVYGDTASVKAAEMNGRTALITIKGHDAVETDDKRPKFKR